MSSDFQVVACGCSVRRGHGWMRQEEETDKTGLVKAWFWFWWTVQCWVVGSLRRWWVVLGGVARVGGLGCGEGGGVSTVQWCGGVSADA